MLALLSLAAAAVAGARELSLKMTTNKADALYQPGEEMVSRIQLLRDGDPVLGRGLRWLR